MDEPMMNHRRRIEEGNRQRRSTAEIDDGPKAEIDDGPKAEIDEEQRLTGDVESVE